MSANSLECVLVGDESLLLQCAQILRDHGHSVAAIVTENPSIASHAAKSGIHVTGWGGDLAASLADVDYDWLFSAANLRIIPEPVWRKARAGAANFHDGPLPRYAGLNAPAWAILNGETSHGVTWHEIAAGVDEGLIYVQETFDIAPDETALTLNTKCFEAGISTFATLLQEIEAGTLAGKPQDLAARSYYAKALRPQAGATLRFDQSAEALMRLVRGLDFGKGYANPLGVPKLYSADGVYAVTSMIADTNAAHGAPGTVLSVSKEGVVIAAADQPVRITGSRIGDDADMTAVLTAGTILPRLDAAEMESLSQAVGDAARHEDAHRRLLSALHDVDLMDVRARSPESRPDPSTLPLDLPAGLSREGKLAAIAGFMLRLSDQDRISLAYADDAVRQAATQYAGYFLESVPLGIDMIDGAPIAAFTAGFSERLAEVRKHGPVLSDLPLRYPNLTSPLLTVGLVDGGEANALPHACAVAFVAGDTGDALVFDRNRLSQDQAEALAAHLSVFAEAFAENSARMADLPLMSVQEEQKVLHDWNDTESTYDPACMHVLFERQVDRTPDAAAVASGAVELSCRQLDERANRIAHALIAQGVGPDVMVGLHVSRSVDLVAGALGILKAGGAYVPLDPQFPADRLELMIGDSAAPVVLTERALKSRLAAPGATVLVIEDIVEVAGHSERPSVAVAPENLAYVIYTSGSTGRPKGVMLEHRNVANFFAGMDERIPVPAGEQPVWLAVTSLSFDISVLELFWTLARGFKVVIHSAEVTAHKSAGYSGRALDFGLFYWGNDDGAGPQKYRLLLEGAKFADDHGFQAVWTPERHFHAFGGPYPNPSVTGAAVAAVTKNLSIRAGSCVLPLHHPARVAEEWAIIDNISNGRAGLAFASGWMPEDFVLRPENAPPHNKAAMLRDIETVRRLWRGDKVEFDFGSGTVGVVTQPRPVQKELPVWVTTAGNPETYRDAARLGANVLTHLLGQSIPELAEKIRIYRETLVECGRDPADYKVTLMLHTLLGEDREEVRNLAREPMKDYLRSATALIKQYAWAFPAFKKPQGVDNPMEIDLQGLADDELDAILEFAFLRYFDDSGLFGTVDDAMRRIEEISGIGVDEVACLIDYGVASATVMERLKPLAEVVARTRGAADEMPAQAPRSFAQDIAEHRVTHLQCTPSMARMFMVDEASRQALRDVRHLFIGGEALSAALVSDLRKATSASIENMYGPTETTIWSSTMTVGEVEGVVPLGRPIANTQLYALDRNGRPVPPGMPGELYIGGDGVARGYHNRPDLTAERFFPNPYRKGRFYRTGDLVRFLDDGTLQFLGRADHQVKVRGYRIELGEIEARIAEFPGIAEAVVVAREDRADDVRIVAYLRLAGGTIDEEALRAHLAQSLPHYMMPAHLVTLDAFPLTPNAKVDRKALPRPDVKPQVEAAAYVAPVDNMQREIAETFRRILGVERVGLSDSFFALGGHSLLAVQAHRELKAGVAPDMAITDLFRFPTVSALAGHLSDRGKSDERLSKVASRAAARRAALGGRMARTQPGG